MSFELVIWHEPEPITLERASAASADRAALPPHPAVAGFARAFASEFPDADLGVRDSRYAVIRMAPEHADEISTQVYALAKTHGLVCYDPHRGLVHNLAPKGVHPETQLRTGDGLIVTDPDLALVREVLGHLTMAGNPFAALVLFGHHFIQVSPEPGGYELEYKDSPRDRLYRTHVDELGEVRRAFEEYARDGRGFLDRYEWDSPAGNERDA